MATFTTLQEMAYLATRLENNTATPGDRQRLEILLEREIGWRLGGWKTAPLSDGQRIALRTALAFGVPGARSLNSALGTTAEFAQDAGWDEPYPRTVKEYRLACLRDRIPIQMTTWEAPKF